METLLLDGEFGEIAIGEPLLDPALAVGSPDDLTPEPVETDDAVATAVPISEVVQSAQDGDEAAFADMWRRCTPLVSYTAARIVGKERAEDVAQIAAMRVYRGLSSFNFPPDKEKAEPYFRAWVKRITANASLDEIRRDSSRIQPVSLDLSNPQTGRATEIADGSAGIDAPGDRLLSADVIQRAIDAVQPEFRDEFRAIVVEGMGNGEYADASGTHPATVNSRLRRARLALQEKIRNGEIEGLAHR